ITVEPGALGVAVKVKVGGEVVGCLGTGAAGAFLCPPFTTFPPSETAAELETMLEGAFGTSEVEVSGGPVGVEPFVVTTPDRQAPAISLERVSSEVPEALSGKGQATTLSTGGSGRLVVTVTNLGNAPVDGSSEAITITD